MASLLIQLNLDVDETRTDYEIVSDMMKEAQRQMGLKGIQPINTLRLRGDAKGHTTFIGYRTVAQRNVIQQVFEQAGHKILK
jgi:hypothetical protein